jgi:hypothetical protein
MEQNLRDDVHNLGRTANSGLRNVEKALADVPI